MHQRPGVAGTEQSACGAAQPARKADNSGQTLWIFKETPCAVK